MKNHSYVRAGRWAGAAVLGVLTGCTTYVHERRQQTVYAPAPPPVEAPEVVVTPAPPPAPEPVVSVVEIRSTHDFYEPLSPYGHWIQTSEYGLCWVPDRIDRDWRPYCNGHWQPTDAGWYWVSDEPWGWATYHYGRWDWRPEMGWIWVPQTQWAPAWVSFHRGGGYMGWAPLHPSARIREGRVEEEPARHGRDREFVFVKERSFLEPVRPANVVVNNTTVINQTVNITNIKVVNNTVVNEGPQVSVVEKANGQRIRPVAVREMRKQEAAVLASEHRAPSSNQADRSSSGRPANDIAERKGPPQAERHSAEAFKQSSTEATHHDSTASQTRVDASRKTNDTDLKVPEAGAQRRNVANNAQAETETKRKAKEAELKAAQAEAARRTNAGARVESQRRPGEADVKTNRPIVSSPNNAAVTRPQTETERRPTPVEIKTARSEGQQRAPEAQAMKKPAATRGEDAITARITAVFASDPALRGVHVVRSNAVVHLNGAVPSAEHKKRAGELAQKIETARPVQNNLTIRP